MNALSRDQLKTRKERSVQFVRHVLSDSERADEITDESLEDYCDRRKIPILNNLAGGNVPRVRLMNPPRNSNTRRKPMQENPLSGRSELLARIRELQQENDELQDKLDKVADLAAAPEGDCDESPDELVDKLNEIIDVVVPENEDDGERND
jgi:hypothetical protein